MSSTRRSSLRAGAVAGCALSLLACSPSSDVAQLGTYFERSEDDDADAGAETGPGAEGPLEASTPSDGAVDAGRAGDAALDGEQPDGSSDLDPFPADAPPCARTGCVSAQAPTQAEPDLHCQRVVFGADPSPPLPPDSSPDHYVGFEFMPEVQGLEYLRSIAPIIDDVSILHHLKLFESQATSDPTNPRPPPRLIYSWAPGGSGLFLDPSVGVPVSPDTNYIFEVHYGAGAAKVFDGSGFKICFSRSAPTHPVSFSGLRAKGPPAGPATGTCSVQHSGPIVLLSAQPNATAVARSVKVTLERPGASALSIVDEPYDHEFVPFRALSVLLRAGDALHTRCDNVPPLTPDFDARCEVSVLHWPAHTLVSAGAADALDSCGP